MILRFLVSGFRFLVPGFWFLVGYCQPFVNSTARTRNQKPETRNYS
jgi:hypothetical protein